MFKRSLLFPGLLAMALAGSTTSSCVVGAPPGFSDGDLWSVPLVAPLENDLLLVPVSINGEGPFLFMVDPDSPESSVEASLQASLNLFAGRAGAQRATEDDHLNRIIIAQIVKMSIGDLDIRNMRVRVHDDGTYWSGSRRVRGILGRDVISDSLIYKFDRDKGMMYIATQGNLKHSEEAKKISFTQSYNKHRRYLAKVQLNRKHKLTMHLDLGARTSMIWARLIKKFKMPSIPVQAELVDEYGFRRTVNNGTIAGIVGANEVEATAVTMLPYKDKRIDKDDLDGVIGLNVWNKYTVTVNWHHKKFWLEERNSDLTADAAARVLRWGDQLDDCATLACLRPTLEGRPEPVAAPAAPEPVAASDEAPASEQPPMDPAAPVATPAPTPAPVPPPAPTPAPVPVLEPVRVADPVPLSLLIERDAPGTDFAYDAVVAAVDANGAMLDLPIFLASFPAGVSSLKITGLGPDYAQSAKFVVLDMNPVGTRGCEGNQCIYPMRNPQ